MASSDLINKPPLYAAIKYKTQEKDFIEVEHLFKRKAGTTKVAGPFQPQHLTDFVEGRYAYVANTLHGSADKKRHKYFVMIGRLGHTVEEVDEKNSAYWNGKRIHYPTVPNQSSLEPSSESDEENGNSAEKSAENQNSARSLRQDKARRKKLQKNAADSEQAQLLSLATKNISSAAREACDPTQGSRSLGVASNGHIGAESNAEDTISGQLRELLAFRESQERDMRDFRNSVAVLSEQFADFKTLVLSMRQDLFNRLSTVESNVTETMSECTHARMTKVNEWLKSSFGVKSVEEVGAVNAFLPRQTV